MKPDMTKSRSTARICHQDSKKSLEYYGLNDTTGEPLRLICIALGIAWLALVCRIAAHWI
jgi:hypothetical protein